MRCVPKVALISMPYVGLLPTAGPPNTTASPAPSLRRLLWLTEPMVTGLRDTAGRQESGQKP